MTPCPAHLDDGALACSQPAGHTHGHTYVSSEPSDRHEATEAAAERGRG